MDPCTQENQTSRSYLDACGGKYYGIFLREMVHVPGGYLEVIYGTLVHRDLPFGHDIALATIHALSGRYATTMPGESFIQLNSWRYHMKPNYRSLFFVCAVLAMVFAVSTVVLAKHAETVKTDDAANTPDAALAADPAVASALKPPSVPAMSASAAVPALASRTLPEGTELHVRLEQSISSRDARPGDTFRATVFEPVVVEGVTVVPRGAVAMGLVVEAKHAGHLRGAPKLQLALTGVEVEGREAELHTDTHFRAGKGHMKRNFAWIGGSGGGGMMIGALAAGGKGALIGGPIGAGAGTLAAYLTGKHDINFPVETRLTFKLSEATTFDHKS